MARDEKLEVLRGVPLFTGLGRRELERLGELGDEVDLPAGRTFVREGERGHEFFVILDGRVRIERGGQTLTTLGRGDFLGEIALVDGGPRTATAICEDDARLLVISHREFHSLLEEFPKIAVEILQALGRRVRQLTPDHPH